MKNSVFIACFLMFVLSSCCDGRKSEANNIDFKEYAMDSTYHLFGDVTKPSIKISLSMQYPVRSQNQSVLDSLQRLIMASVTANPGQAQQNPEEAMRNFIMQKIAEYRMLESDYEDASPETRGNDFNYSFSNEYMGEERNVFNRDGIFCFSNRAYSFTGGAHGLETVVHKCVDLNNGTVITPKDLFTGDDAELFLTTLILEKLAEMQKVKSPEKLEEIGFFDVSSIKPGDNFFLNEKGITFVYNPYEIAAYYLGILEVFIPYGDITAILASQSPIKRIIN